MIGLIGRMKGGIRSVVYNREAYPELALIQCLSDPEISLVKGRHSASEEVASEKWLTAVTSHIEICEKCRLLTATALDLEIMADGLDYESMHTSLPPDKAGSIYCQPDREEKFIVQDITNWDDVIVH